MIEEIERVSAKLYVESLCYLGVLNQRQVEVRESGAIERVAAQIAETVRRDGERGPGVGNPLGRISADLHRRDQIRADGVGCAIDVGRGDNDCERIAGLESHDRCQFPSADDAVAFERKRVDGIRYEPVPRVEIGTPAAVEDVCVVLHQDSVVVAGHVVDRV